MRENPALMQHDDIVLVRDFIDEMRRPQDRHSFRGDKVAHMTDDVGPRLDVEANRRLVKNEQARAVQQRASDLETSHLSTGKVAHLVLGALGERNALEDVIRTLSTLAVADAVQRRMVGQVLDDREIEIEGAGWNTTPTMRSASLAAVPTSWPKMRI